MSNVPRAMRRVWSRPRPRSRSCVRPSPPTATTRSSPAADLDPAHAKLTVRQGEADPRVSPADLAFRFDGPNKTSIARPEGFDAGAIYELIYQATDPKVMGLGFAATRELVSFLRN